MSKEDEAQYEQVCREMNMLYLDPVKESAGDSHKLVMIVQVESGGIMAGNFARIKMNDDIVEIPNNHNGN